MGNSINISKYLGSKVRGIESPGETLLFLDLLPGAAASYSLRRQRESYSGNVVRVRRASDNTELDIPFSGNEINLSVLNAFCSGTNGFVTVMYGQDVTLNNARQTSLLFQPKIYDSVGGVITQNGKPAILFDGVDDRLVLDNPVVLSLTGHSIFDLVSVNSVTTSTPAMLKYSGSPSGTFFSEMLYGYGSISGTLTNETEYFTSLRAGQIYGYGDTASPLNGQYIGAVAYKSDLNIALITFTYRRNNNLISLNTATTGGFDSNREPDDFRYIGSRNDGTLPFSGYFQELNFYASDQTANLSIGTTNINNYYNVYP